MAPAWQATVAEMEQNGFAVIEDALTSAQVEQMLTCAKEYVTHYQNAVRMCSFELAAKRTAAKVLLSSATELCECAGILDRLCRPRGRAGGAGRRVPLARSKYLRESLARDLETSRRGSTSRMAPRRRHGATELQPHVPNVSQGGFRAHGHERTQQG